MFKRITNIFYVYIRNIQINGNITGFFWRNKSRENIYKNVNLLLYASQYNIKNAFLLGGWSINTVIKHCLIVVHPSVFKIFPTMFLKCNLENNSSLFPRKKIIHTNAYLKDLSEIEEVIMNEF